MILQQVRRSIGKSGVFTVLLLVQLSLAFLVCNTVLHTSLQAAESRKQFDKNYHQKQYYRVTDDLMDEDMEYRFWESEDSLLRIKNYDKELSKDRHYNFYQVIFQQLGIEDFQGPEQFYELYEKEPDVHRSDFTLGSKKYNVVKNVMISRGVMKEFGFHVCQGELLKGKDFVLSEGQTRIPILLGYGYRDIYQVGDVLQGEYYSKPLELVVAGILDQDTGVIQDSNNDSGEYLVYLDRMMVTPMLDCSYEPPDEEDRSFQQTLYLMKTNGTVSVQNENSFYYFLNKMNDLRQKYDIFEFNVINEPMLSIELLSMNLKDGFWILLSVAILALLFSILSMSVVLSCKIVENRRDYGIVRLVGCSKPALYFSILLEAVVLAVIGNGVAFLMNAAIFNGMVSYRWEWFLLSVGFVLPGCIGPINELSKETIDSGIRGKN
ncbi:MAG TPA: hypothetical protein DDW86_06395 [Clostridiales bacterium]|jgi:hypothetical protein|nr:hypothetical protein [Clostridiales bacterium]